MNSFSQSEPAVRAILDDISDNTRLGVTLRDFAQRLTEMHRDLTDKEGKYYIMPGQANQTVHRNAMPYMQHNGTWHSA